MTGWCILWTSPGATITLAESLREAGFETWTPVETVRPEPPKIEPWEKKKPRPRRKLPDFITRPMLPTYVFARADRVDDLRALSHAPALTHLAWDSQQSRMVVKGHPFFRIFASGNRTIPDEQLADLRRIEGRRRKPRGKVPTFNPGDRVRMTEGAYEGLRGTVVRIEGKMTVVRFDEGIHEPRIHSWLLFADLDEPQRIHNKGSEPEPCFRDGRKAAEDGTASTGFGLGTVPPKSQVGSPASDRVLPHEGDSRWP